MTKMKSNPSSDLLPFSSFHWSFDALTTIVLSCEENRDGTFQQSDDELWYRAAEFVSSPTFQWLKQNHSSFCHIGVKLEALGPNLASRGHLYGPLNSGFKKKLEVTSVSTYTITN